ncbi:MAG: Fe(3+) ABC transporter substrate-binding protein [Alphaproteobacteria bacterium]|nr:Fe(3+) ABC transporter substrate-binding protein [Pseudomonadota bacterium]TDI66264.1 MAG: Fe(3+) ABC transporter substrate-binding protein [Alphaproteobacteria bacterium]
MIPSQRVFAIPYVAWAAAALLAAGPAAITPARAAGEVNVYSSRHYKADRELFKRFTAKTGIRVNVVQGRANALFERLKREGRNSPADLLITVDAGNLARAQAAKLFQPVRSAFIDAAVPAAYREPAGHWVGLTLRARVIMYHKDRVKPDQLSTYEALADPRWKGRILIRSSNNIYNQSLVASLIAANGASKTLAWAKALVANLARKPKGGDRDQIRAVGTGEGDIAIANTYYLGRLAASKKARDKALVKKIGVFFPNQGGRGAHVNISGAGVTRFARNKAEAVKLLEFLVEKESQILFSKANYEYPVRPDVPISKIIASWGEFRADKINVSELGTRNAEAVRLMDRAGWR